MKFDLYGRKVIEVVRNTTSWKVYYCGENGVKRPAHDVRIPDDIKTENIPQFLDDALHEWSTPDNTQIIRIDQSAPKE